MSKSKNDKKGDDKMEHKDLWLVIGLTVILAVAVSISTVSITGDAVFAKKAPTGLTLYQTQMFVMEKGDSVTLNGLTLKIDNIWKAQGIYDVTKIITQQQGKTAENYDMEKGDSVTVGNGVLIKILDIGKMQLSTGEIRDDATISITIPTYTITSFKLPVPIYPTKYGRSTVRGK